MKMKKGIEWLKSKGMALTAVVIVPIIIIIIIPLFQRITNSMVNTVASNISTQYAQDLSTQMTTNIFVSMSNHYEHMDLIYSLLETMDDVSEEELLKFAAKTKESEGVSFIGFADDGGYVYSSEGTFLGTISISIMGNLLNGDTKMVSDTETIGNESLILLGNSYPNPIKIGNRKICIVLYGMSRDKMTEEIVLNNSFSGGYSSIIHKDGSFIVKNTLLVYPGLNVYEILDENGLASNEHLTNVKQAVEKGKDYLFSTVNTKEKRNEFIYFAPIEGTEWYSVNIMPGEFVLNNVVAVKNTIFNICIITIVIFMVICLVFICLQAKSKKKLIESRHQLSQALELAQAASESKTSFLFNMSHDIRTPMNAILGFTQMGLKHTGETERTRDCFEKILSAGGHLLNLINDILEMSRVESGKMELVDKPLDIRRAIFDVGLMAHSLADAKGVEYETVCGEIKNPYIYADELHVNEIIINLISNAVKYTPSGGKVRYLINQISDEINGKVTFRFEIVDNGIGMSEEFQRHLFEAFSREENTTVSGIEGTGLGLSIVKKIIDLAKGEIKVKSRQGEGSSFMVELGFTVMDEEAIQNYRQENELENELLSDISLEGARVLLVEDNDMNREIATELLEDAGLSVETAENGQVALKAVLEKGVHYFNFILMDIQMPVMNGFEATKAIRALPDGNDVPIIGLSANAFEEDVKKSKEIGMDAHVAKPINVKALFDTLHSFMK